MRYKDLGNALGIALYHVMAGGLINSGALEAGRHT